MLKGFYLAWSNYAPSCYLTSGAGGLLFYYPENIDPLNKKIEGDKK